MVWDGDASEEKWFNQTVWSKRRRTFYILFLRCSGVLSVHWFVMRHDRSVLFANSNLSPSNQQLAARRQEMSQLQNFVVNERAAYGPPTDVIMLNFHLELREALKLQTASCNQITMNCFFYLLFFFYFFGRVGGWWKRRHEMSLAGIQVHEFLSVTLPVRDVKAWWEWIDIISPGAICMSSHSMWVEYIQPNVVHNVGVGIAEQLLIVL